MHEVTVPGVKSGQPFLFGKNLMKPSHLDVAQEARLRAYKRSDIDGIPAALQDEAVAQVKKRAGMAETNALLFLMLCQADPRLAPARGEDVIAAADAFMGDLEMDTYTSLAEALGGKDEKVEEDKDGGDPLEGSDETLAV